MALEQDTGLMAEQIPRLYVQALSVAGTVCFQQPSRVDVEWLASGQMLQ